MLFLEMFLILVYLAIFYGLDFLQIGYTNKL